MIGPPPLGGARDDARRHPDQDAEHDGDRRELEGRREEVEKVGQHGLRRDDGRAEVAVQELAQVDQVLFGDRPVEADGRPGRLVGASRRAVTHDGQDGVDGDEPTDHEGDDRQTEEAEHRRDQDLPKGR